MSVKDAVAVIAVLAFCLLLAFEAAWFFSDFFPAKTEKEFAVWQTATFVVVLFACVAAYAYYLTRVRRKGNWKGKKCLRE